MSGATLLNMMLDRQTLPEIVDFSSRVITRKRGAIGLDVDLYNDAERKRPIAEARWTVARFKWNGLRWQRERKLCGPRPFEAALEELNFQCRRLNHPKISEA